MQSCSVQHCVLFLLTLYTLTTDPGSATCEFPFYATLHHPVTLPCETQCSGRGWWSLDSNREVVFAECDQTSCTSVQQGFNMSYTQFKSGDLSLTITKPDYSMRKKYTCECEKSDYATVRLRISTVFSTVQMQTEGDLKLNLSVPEPVEVIYRGRDSADDVQICTVTNRTLQCNTEYTPRTSLSYPELTLRDMERSESGTYTIRNLDYKEDIRVYAVSVSGLTPGEIVGIVIGVLLLVAALLIAGVMCFKKKAAAWGKVVKAMAMVKKAVKAMKKARTEIKDLEEKYSEDDTNKESIRSFCNDKRRDLGLWSDITEPEDSEPRKDILELKKVDKTVETVEETVKKAVRALKKARTEIKDLEEKYSEDDTNKEYITWFCNDKRSDLGLWSDITEPEDSEPWGAYIMDQNPEALARQMETASRILERLKRETSAENRVVSQPHLIRMFTRVKECLEAVNSWSKKDKSDIALQIKKWSVDKMMELNHYRGKLLPAETTETPQNTDRGENEPLVSFTQQDTEA